MLQILLIAIAITVVPALESGSHPHPSPSSEIQRLIVELDSDKFAAREAATLQLASYGESALKPLASHYLENSSTESAWRVKRVLTQIGTESENEESSLKAIGVLLVLDSRAASNEKLKSLIDTWRENRSKRAINYLVSRGASRQNNDFNRQIFFPQPVLRFQQNPVIKPSRNPLRVSKPKKYSASEAKSKINELVAGDFDSIQKFVFARLPEDPNQSNKSLVNGGLQAQIQGFGNVRQDLTILEVGDKWTGTSKDLQKLTEIHSLGAVRIKDQTLTQVDLRTLAKLDGLAHLGLDNVKVKAGHVFDIELPQGVNSIELTNQEIESETLRWMAKKSVSSLTIDDCQFTRNSLQEFSKLTSLEMLDLRRLKLDADFFVEMAQIPGIRRIVLSVCKFKASTYRQFAARRPSVIAFNPVSFLGVQGSPNSRRPGSFTCEIELVVQGSSAEQAGIHAGDIIESVNGESVQSFTDLRMFISQHDIGETMEVGVLRKTDDPDKPSERKKLTVTLGENPDRPFR